MCGRYQAWVEDDELVRIIEREKKGNAARYLQNNEVFPGSAVPVIYGSYANVRAHISTWGYHQPSEGSGSKILINARSESAMTKNLFKNAISNAVPTERRILVLTSGYYEWKSDEENHKKQKYHISLGQGSPMLLCGLEADQPDGTRRHVILTTAASGVCADIHHRMPLICPREEMRQWLYDTDFAVKKLKDTRVYDLTLACS